MQIPAKLDYGFQREMVKGNGESKRLWLKASGKFWYRKICWHLYEIWTKELRQEQHFEKLRSRRRVVFLTIVNLKGQGRDLLSNNHQRSKRQRSASSGVKVATEKTYFYFFCMVDLHLEEYIASITSIFVNVSFLRAWWGRSVIT